MLRIYLTGRVCIEAGDVLLDERAFPGRQGRLAFAVLALERRRAVPRDELADALWPEALPRAWEVALSAVVSNLRALLGRAGLARADVIAQAFACYQLRLPTDTWIDVEAAGHSLDEAEGALRAQDPARAYGWAGVASAIARRPLLPGEEGAWLERHRADLRRVHLRALDCFTDIFAWSGETALAVNAVEEALALDPFRETSYQQLMRLQVASGNRAGALRTYQRCRTLLARQLGVDPSVQTEAVYLEALRSS